MPRQSTILELLIASPSDVDVERQIVAEVLEDWNSANSRLSGLTLLPIRWLLDAQPESGDRYHALVSRQIVHNADFVVALFYARIGTPAGFAVTGTVEEIEGCRAKGKNVLVYFSEAHIPREHDAEQLQLLNVYRSNLRSQGLYRGFRDGHDLRRRLSLDLASMVAGASYGVESWKTAPKLAKLIITSTLGSKAGENRIGVIVVLKNISESRIIDKFAVDTVVRPTIVTDPKELGTLDKVASERLANQRQYRKTNQDFDKPCLYAGDEIVVLRFEIDTTVYHFYEHLRTELSSVLAEQVSIVASVDGEVVKEMRLVSDLFEMRRDVMFGEPMPNPIKRGKRLKRS